MNSNPLLWNLTVAGTITTYIKISSIELRGVASAYIENNIAEFDDVTAIIYPPATLYKTVRV